MSVIVPYFENQRGLDRLLAALAQQDHPVEEVEVVVADDGSARGRRAISGRALRGVMCSCSWTGT